MTQEHTPGPWLVIPACLIDEESGYVSPASIEGADGNAVCVFADAEGSGTLLENEADYPLIASAPDLLAALDFMVNVSRATPGFSAMARQQAEAAIAKATGQQVTA